MTVAERSSLFVDAGATFSPNRRYRYRLWRRWAEGRAVLWVMLNPSTADEHVLDPTLRRCAAFARAWGFGRFDVCNLFALRSTDPKAIYTAADPVGPGNDDEIVNAAMDADLVLVGWGVHGEFQARAEAVTTKLLGACPAVWCLGLSKDGHPKHPLYLPAATKRELFRARSCTHHLGSVGGE